MAHTTRHDDVRLGVYSAMARHMDDSPTQDQTQNRPSLKRPDLIGFDGLAKENQQTRTTVLIVEDDGLLRELVSSRLQASGFRVVEAGSAEKALAILSDTSAEILVTDIGLPGLDGWSLGRQARHHAPELQIIYMSSKPLRATDQAPAGVYLQKPFHPDAVIEAIRQDTSGEIKRTGSNTVGSVDAKVGAQLGDVGGGEQVTGGSHGENSAGVDEGGE